MSSSSGTLRQMSIQMPTAVLSGRLRASRDSARAKPTMSESTIAMSAIWTFTRKPSKTNRALLPVVSHSQLSESKR
jgi:hypothetical protein